MASSTAFSTQIPGSLKAIKPEAFGYGQARHLLWRAGFGGSPKQIQMLVDWGPERAVDHLLNVGDVEFDSDPADLFDRNIVQPPTPAVRRAYADARRAQDEDTLARLRKARQMIQRNDRGQLREIQRWWLKRMIETPKPLEEKMTLFWHGHFATSYRTIENSFHMYKQNRLFRQHALGNFGELLFEIIRDPAMIAYLDNNDSRKGRANENLARELMELFSLGVGNYSERDIKEGARSLTGYTFVDDEFVFNINNHDADEKSILGHYGRLDGDDFVKAILSTRDCADFITQKLYRFFVAGLPENIRSLDRQTKNVLRDMSSTFRRARFDVAPVLRELFLSEHFYSPGVISEQIKSPVTLVVGAVRSLETPVRDLSILLDTMDLMGQNLLMPPSVKGWEGGRSWINTSTLFVRQNSLSFLLVGKKPVGYDALADTEVYDPKPLLDGIQSMNPNAPPTVDEVVAHFLRFTIGRTPEHASATLRAFLANHDDAITQETLTGMLLLITAMPEYQLC